MGLSLRFSVFTSSSLWDFAMRMSDNTNSEVMKVSAEVPPTTDPASSLRDGATTSEVSEQIQIQTQSGSTKKEIQVKTIHSHRRCHLHTFTQLHSFLLYHWWVVDSAWVQTEIIFSDTPPCFLHELWLTVSVKHKLPSGSAVTCSVQGHTPWLLLLLPQVKLFLKIMILGSTRLLSTLPAAHLQTPRFCYKSKNPWTSCLRGDLPCFFSAEIAFK